MVTVNTHFLKVAFVVLVALLIVTLTLQGFCDRAYHHQPISQMPKRTLRYEDSIVSCDIVFVLSGSSNITGHEKLTKTYNCSNARSYVFQPKSDYECMLYAMLTNPNCKGYLLLSADAQQL